MFWPNLKSVASPVPETIAIGVWDFGVGVANPQSWGKRRPLGGWTLATKSEDKRHAISFQDFQPMLS